MRGGDELAAMWARWLGEWRSCRWPAAGQSRGFQNFARQY
jgi:hypothetical protein